VADRVVPAGSADLLIATSFKGMDHLIKSPFSNLFLGYIRNIRPLTSSEKLRLLEDAFFHGVISATKKTPFRYHVQQTKIAKMDHSERNIKFIYLF